MSHQVAHQELPTIHSTWINGDLFIQYLQLSIVGSTFIHDRPIRFERNAETTAQWCQPKSKATPKPNKGVIGDDKEHIKTWTSRQWVKTIQNYILNGYSRKQPSRPEKTHRKMVSPEMRTWRHQCLHLWDPILWTPTAERIPPTRKASWAAGEFGFLNMAIQWQWQHDMYIYI